VRTSAAGPASGSNPSVRGALVLVHGYGEHARRHVDLAEAAAANGCDVWAFDQAGHGESPGPRAVVNGYAAACAAVVSLLDRATREQGRPPVLLGHSMGGAVALSVALEAPGKMRALALSSPFLLDPVPRPAALLAVARLAARLAPGLPLVRPDDNLISRDPAEVRRYQSDPLNHHGGVPAVTGMTMRSAGAALLARAAALAVPTLIIHGESDGYADVAGSRALAAASPKVELVTIPGGYHELHHEPPHTGVPLRVRERFLDWLASA